MDEQLEEVANLDLGRRGIRPLAEAARDRLGASPIGAAADLLASLPPGSVAVLTTGIATQPWLSTSRIESDGPPGAAVLARALQQGFGLRLLLVAEDEVLTSLHAVLAAAGVNEVGGQVAAEAFPLEAVAAEAAAARLLEEVKPAALISVERLGRNDRGIFHSVTGRDVSLGKAPVDLLFEAGRRRGIPTIGIGDGGNEIGMGAICDAVRDHVPFAARCQCGCGGGAAAVQPTDVLVTGGTSNWAAYAVAGALGVRARRSDLLHSGDDEERLLRAGLELGLVNGMSGEPDLDVDLIPLAVHRAIADLLAEIARRSMAG